MFIKVIYKADPELVKIKRKSTDSDLSIEKHVLVNPDCYVRIMLEYIRNHCRLGESTNFDLCDESGILKGLFSMPTYTNASEMFENKKSYYVVVLKQELDRHTTILPQVNRQGKLYQELKSKVIYKADPELVKIKRKSTDSDLSIEKHVLVNPDCYVRIMLEYIRNHCRLGESTNFDLCDESGILKGLFSMPTYTNASEMFENKKSYYVVVLKQELDRHTTILPQVNRQGKLYQELKSKVSNYLQAQDSSSHVTSSSIGPRGSRNK